MKKVNQLLALIIVISGQLNSAFSQTFTQNISGTVKDVITQEPLIGATVQVLDLPETLGTVTDEEGKFTLNNIPVGRHSLQCSYIGYETRVEMILLNSAKEGFVKFELSSQSLALPLTIVRNSVDALNPMAMVSVRSVTPEETQYYPTSANDFGRAMVSLPGIQPSKDNENDIIIRGNSSAGLLWRLEGVDILNPNHFARSGSSAGGITIFSISVLAESDFSTGAFPAEYGNSFSGIFDLRFRNGNQNNYEYTARAGMLGLDIAAEGPFKKGGSSFLFNYRYSTLGILNKLGMHLVGPRVDNTFQDLSFNLFFPGKNNKSSFKIWGVGGISKEDQKIGDIPAEWVTFKDSLWLATGTDMGVIGATYSLQMGERSFFKTTAAIMGQRKWETESVYFRNKSYFDIEDENYVEGRVSLASVFGHSFSRELYLKAGFQLSSISYDMKHDTIDGPNKMKTYINGDGTTLLAQPYFQWQWTPNPRVTLNAGLHSMYFDLTNSFSVEPRLGLKFQISANQSVSLAYGLHSQYVPLGSYFITPAGTPSGSYPNLNLDLIKSHHFVLGLDRTFSGMMRLRTEFYYQYMFDVPVGISNPGTYAILNDIEGFAKEKLVSEGTGTNYGVDAIFEKFFRGGTFFLISGSVFSSTYMPYNGKRYSSQYDSRVIGAVTGGKEWEFAKGTAIQIGMKALFNNGMPSTPVFQGTSNTTRPVYDQTKPFSEKTPKYYRVDTRFAFRKNKQKSSWLLALDVQNITNRPNKRAFQWVYDTDTKRWERRNQGELIPVLSFQIDF